MTSPCLHSAPQRALQAEAQVAMDSTKAAEGWMGAGPVQIPSTASWPPTPPPALTASRLYLMTKSEAGSVFLAPPILEKTVRSQHPLQQSAPRPRDKRHFLLGKTEEVWRPKGEKVPKGALNQPRSDFFFSLTSFLYSLLRGFCHIYVAQTGFKGPRCKPRLAFNF